MQNSVMGARNFAFLKSEANGSRARNTGVIKSGSGIVEAGTVLGAVTADGEFIPSPDAEVVGSEGAEVAAAILAYTVDATDTAIEATIFDRDCEVITDALKYDASVDDDIKVAAKLAQLDAINVRAR